MSEISSYLRKLEGGYGHWCPGCEEMHYIAVERPLLNGAKWSFDGNVERPTFSPSVKIKIPGGAPDAVECCHYFVTAGEIHYCGDSTHALAGKTVSLPVWPEDVGDA